MENLIKNILNNKNISDVDFHILFTNNENFIEIKSLSDKDVNEINENVSDKNKKTFVENISMYRDLVKHTVSEKESIDIFYYKKKSTYVIVNDILTINHEIEHINENNFPNISKHDNIYNKTIDMIFFDTFSLLITKSSDDVNNVFIKLTTFTINKNKIEKYIKNFMEEYSFVDNILSKYK
jgi:hypothetical protein